MLVMAVVSCMQNLCNYWILINCRLDWIQKGHRRNVTLIMAAVLAVFEKARQKWYIGKDSLCRA